MDAECPPEFVEGEYVQRVTCLICGNAWKEVYSLTDVE